MSEQTIFLTDLSVITNKTNLCSRMCNLCSHCVLRTLESFVAVHALSFLSYFDICYLTDKEAEELKFHTRQAESLQESLAVGPLAVSKTMTNGSPCIPDISNNLHLPTIEIHTCIISRG